MIETQMKAKDLRDQSVEDLETLHLDLRKELFALRTEHKQTASLERAHRLPMTKRNIARVLTVLHEKQKANTKSSS